MNDKRKAADSLFTRLEGLLDLAHAAALDAVEGVFVKVDEAYNSVKNEVFRKLDDAEGVDAEPVKMEPDVETMREDLARHRSSLGFGDNAFKSSNQSAVRDYWEFLPDDAKTWATKDGNSPL